MKRYQPIVQLCQVPVKSIIQVQYVSKGIKISSIILKEYKENNKKPWIESWGASTLDCSNTIST